jgi:hypothetical protein
MSSRKGRLAAALVSALVVLAAARAEAQALGVRTGATVNPDQFFVGANYETRPWWHDRIWFQPGVDAGFGNGVTLIAGNFDVVHRRAFGGRRTPWMWYGGGGPAINYYRFDGFSETDAGMNLVGGLMHRSGWSGEFRVGFMDSPDFRFGVGYSFARVKYQPETTKRRASAKPKSKPKGKN